MADSRASVRTSQWIEKNHMYIPFLGFFILKKYKFLEWIVSTAYESSDGPPSHMVLQDVKP